MYAESKPTSSHKETIVLQLAHISTLIFGKFHMNSPAYGGRDHLHLFVTMMDGEEGNRVRIGHAIEFVTAKVS